MREDFKKLCVELFVVHDQPLTICRHPDKFPNLPHLRTPLDFGLMQDAATEGVIKNSGHRLVEILAEGSLRKELFEVLYALGAGSLLYTFLELLKRLYQQTVKRKDCEPTEVHAHDTLSHPEEASINSVVKNLDSLLPFRFVAQV